MIDVREKAARQFSARLTGRGFEIWVREGNDTYVVGGQEYMPQDLVVVRALDAAGNPVSAEVNVDIATFNLYPDTLTGGAVHGTHQTFAPMAPPVSLGYLLTGRSPERRPVGAGQVIQHVQQHRITVHATGERLPPRPDRSGSCRSRTQRASDAPAPGCAPIARCPRRIPCAS